MEKIKKAGGKTNPIKTITITSAFGVSKAGAKPQWAE
jgi:hypothetical protein